MRESTHSLHRRTALRTLLASGTVGLAGCLDSSGATQSGPLTLVEVCGTKLIVEFEDDHSCDKITVIQPDGESFASRSIARGSTRETVEIGTQYSPGEYTIHALDGDETIDEETLTISPDVQITDLKLGRNHPEEMYEEAGDSTTRSEVIVTIENTGTGPDAVTQMGFEGDVPQPTSKESDQSWIYDTSSEVGGQADRVLIPPNDSVRAYSTSRPFTSASSNVSCTPDGQQGQFTTIVQLRVGESIQQQYNVRYTGEELIDCDISVSEVEE